MKRMLMSITFMSFAAFANAATPTISNVTGTVSSGQILTISGANMMNENVANWDSQFKVHPTQFGFEGTAPDGSDGWYTPSGNAIKPVYDSTVKLSGNKSLKCRINGGMSGNTNDGGSSVWYDAGAENSAFYFRFYSRWNAVNNIWPDNYMKTIFTGLTGTQWYFELSGANSGPPTNWYAKWSGSGTSRPPIAGGALKADKWYLIEGAWTNNPKSMKVWVDNVLTLDVTPTENFGNTYPNIGIINYSSLTHLADVTNYIDNYAFGNSGRIYPSSLVEISNSSTYGQGTVQYQEPVFLSDGSVKIKASLDGLGSGPYYLWVTNNGQTRSAAYNLSGGAVASLSPPTNLQVR